MGFFSKDKQPAPPPDAKYVGQNNIIPPGTIRFKAKIHMTENYGPVLLLPAEELEFAHIEEGAFVEAGIYPIPQPGEVDVDEVANRLHQVAIENNNLRKEIDGMKVDRENFWLYEIMEMVEYAGEFAGMWRNRNPREAHDSKPNPATFRPDANPYHGHVDVNFPDEEPPSVTPVEPEPSEEE